jgi:hypothetical protein
MKTLGKIIGGIILASILLLSLPYSLFAMLLLLGWGYIAKSEHWFDQRK